MPLWEQPPNSLRTEEGLDSYKDIPPGLRFHMKQRVSSLQDIAEVDFAGLAYWPGRIPMCAERHWHHR